MKEKIIKSMIADIIQKYNNNKTKRNIELNKLMRFIKALDYFAGKRRKLYTLIIENKKK